MKKNLPSRIGMQLAKVAPARLKRTLNNFIYGVLQFHRTVKFKNLFFSLTPRRMYRRLNGGFKEWAREISCKVLCRFSICTGIPKGSSSTSRNTRGLGIKGGKHFFKYRTKIPAGVAFYFFLCFVFPDWNRSFICLPKVSCTSNWWTKNMEFNKAFNSCPKYISTETLFRGRNSIKKSLQISGVDQNLSVNEK